MSEVVINVTKVEEVVTINATPNVTQILVNTNSGGGIQSVVAGTNITIDDTDPLNPIISASGGGGAVDSVNGQTGVVVLDADDVGAEPTRGSNDNYVTDAQLVIIGNTSGSNSGDNATNTTSNAYADAKVASELASFKTANFLDFTSSGQTQLDGKVDKTGWIDYSDSSTIVGWASYTTKLIFIKKLDDNLSLVMFQISGVSNATTSSFTLDVEQKSILGSSQNVTIVNSGSASATNGRVVMSVDSNLVDIRRDALGTAWSSSGTKTAVGQFFIKTA